MRSKASLLASTSMLAALSLACTLEPGEDTPPPAPVAPAAPSPTPTTTPTKVPATAPTPAQAPSPIGTRHLVHYQRQGFLYAAVVTGTFGDDTVSVVYADGDTEQVGLDALYPEQLAVGARVEARIRSWPRFFPGRIARRIGHAVFVEFDDGEREWTSIGLVRMPLASASRTAAPVPDAEPRGTLPEVGAPVLANYHGEGWFYPAVLQEARGDQLHVIYADGDSETLPATQVRADVLQPGTAVQARPRGTDAPVDGILVRRVGHAVELRLADGQKVWAALGNVRVR